MIKCKTRILRRTQSECCYISCNGRNRLHDRGGRSLLRPFRRMGSFYLFGGVLGLTEPGVRSLGFATLAGLPATSNSRICWRYSIFSFAFFSTMRHAIGREATLTVFPMVGPGPSNAPSQRGFDTSAPLIEEGVSRCSGRSGGDCRRRRSEAIVRRR